MYGEEDPFYVTSGLRSADRHGGRLTRVGDGGALFQQVQRNYQRYPLGLQHTSGVNNNITDVSYFQQ